jgi:outer membrane murein-binding lipoprotein Lpp
MILLLSISIPAVGSTSARSAQGGRNTRLQTAETDSVSRARLTNINDMAKRVDSLQFVVVYNAELLRQDLGWKVIWIYVMLGVMIVATMMMFGALNQAQRQRKELEERVFSTLATSVANMEAKIVKLESEIESPAPPRRSASPKKKRKS